MEVKSVLFEDVILYLFEAVICKNLGQSPGVLLYKETWVTFI